MVRTRMAPSPTGEYHVGHIATLLKNYAFAKKQGGAFVLRIEDTDQVRKVEGAEEKIIKIIHQFGLDWDEGPDKGGPHAPYRQSERLPIYAKAVQELLDADKAYYCFATSEELAIMREEQQKKGLPPKYDGRYREYPKSEALKRITQGEPYVVRLKVPENRSITFTDLIRGEISVPSDSVDDQVLLKSDGFPTYHLAVVVDDHAMEITHVMRGEEWISSTPKHILLYEAFGWNPPIYAHIPVFLNPDGKGKMSKRKGTVSAQSFLDSGFLPEALLNFFMILGWAHPTQKEILSLEEYIEAFDPSDISAKSVVFDLQKLRWINGVYIRKLNPEELKQRIKPFVPNSCDDDCLNKILPLIHERLETLSDFTELTSFFYSDISVERDMLLKKASAEIVQNQLSIVLHSLETLDSWEVATLEHTLRELVVTHDWKKSQFFMLIRYAVSGCKATPPLFDMMYAIGKETVLTRLHSAQSLIAE